MIPLSKELRVFHSFLSTEVHLIVYSFIQQVLAELPIFGTGVTTVNKTDRPLSSWRYIPVGGLDNEQVKIFTIS